MSNKPSDRKNVRGDAGITTDGNVYIVNNKGPLAIGKDICIETDISDSKRITEEKYGCDALVVGGAKILEKLEEYINRNYKDIGYWEIESYDLETKITGNNNSDPDYYKVTVKYKRTGDTYSRTALVKADPNTGEIIGFKERFNEARFLAAFKKT